MKNLFKLLFVLGIGLLSAGQTVRAANFNYFEFSPDLTSALKIAGLQAPAQSFTPFNDFVSGFDIWLENQGSAGNLSVSLADSSGATLASKTVSAPATGKTWFGQKLHVDFNAPVQVEAGSPYRVVFSSSLPQLKIFYAPLARLRQHNADYALDKSVGAALLAGAPQDFAFKFSLYDDDRDDRAPETQNVVPVLDSPESARILFNSNEPVEAKLEIALSDQILNLASPYQNFFKRCNEEIETCGLAVAVLPDQTYDFRLTLRDYWGSEAWVFGSFGTSAGWVYQAPTSTPLESGDLLAPEISEARAVNVGDKSATIVWRTNEPANSSILLRYDRPGAQIITSIGDGTYELEHALAFSGLEPQTKYYALVTSIDPANNSASQNVYFQTAAAPPAALPPSIPPQTLQISVSSQTNSGAVSWNPLPSAPADGFRLDIFDSQNRLVSQKNVSKDALAAELAGLGAGEYTVIVYQNNNGVFEKIAAPAKVSVPVQAPPAAKQKKIHEQNWFYLAVLGAALALIVSIVIIIKFLQQKKGK